MNMPTEKMANDVSDLGMCWLRLMLALIFE